MGAMTGRPMLRYAVLWAAVVTATATLALGAITRAGAEVALIGAPPPPAAVTGPTDPVGVPGATASSSAASSTTTATSSNGDNGTSGTPGGTGSPAPAKPSASTPARPVVATYSTSGGQVWAYCEGGSPRVRSVVPADGWRFETSTESGRLKITFERESTDDDVEVRIRCAGNGPVFSLD